jgi:capsular exopolysaccharide synthesis family protein
MTNGSGVDIRDYLRALRAGWALLLLGLVLGAGVAAAVSSALPKQYTVGSQLFVSTTTSGDLATTVQGGYYAQDKVASYAQLISSKDLAAAVIDADGLDVSPQQLVSRISATVIPDTTVIDVSVTDKSPQRALELARSLNDEFRAMIRRLETPPGATTSPVQVNVVASPELPTSPSSPTVLPDIALGGVIGLVLATTVAILRHRFDTTVKDDATATELTGAPVIGHLPDVPDLSRHHVLEPHSSSVAAEALRHIRTNLGFLDVDEPPRVIMVTSSVAGEGKTTLAVNLALRLAESGASVALVEADLRRPQVTSYLGLVAGVGLTNVLRRDVEVGEVLQTRADGRLVVLPAGPVPPNPSELLSSEAMATVIEKLANDHDMVIVDAPPALPVADAGAMAGLVDGILLCTRWGTVTAEQLQRTAALFERLGARVMGLVVTLAPARAVPDSYGYQAVPARTGRRGWWGRARPQAAELDVPVVQPRGPRLARTSRRPRTAPSAPETP